MTPDQTIELAKQAGMIAAVGLTVNGNYQPKVNALARSIPIEWLQIFASLVRNEVLEEAAVLCDKLQAVPATEPRHCAEDIRGLKK